MITDPIRKYSIKRVDKYKHISVYLSHMNNNSYINNNYIKNKSNYSLIYFFIYLLSFLISYVHT